MKRLGIYNSWDSESKLLIDVEKGWDRYCEEIWSPRRRALEAYAEGGDPYPILPGLEHTPELVAVNVSQSLTCAGYEYAQVARILFSHATDIAWEPLLGKSWGYEYWRTRISHYHEIGAVRTDRSISFTQAVASLVACLCAGWIKEARILTEEIKILYNRRRFFGVLQQPLYQWIFRVCLDDAELSLDENSDGGGDFKISEPVLDELLKHWRDQDLAPIQDYVIWLCDYYTHRTRRSDWHEFQNDLLLTRFPALILAWQRLREIRGLENPFIDHPLMQPTYARLRPAMPFYTDSVLEATLARLRREGMRDLGAVRQLSPTANAEKRGLIARLFGRI
ncbi:hypothetical protein [Burkholderia multivorans]|uniref:hypothetical protein n=1 Tax=Burkholderia multivorans TaxID=87883 RepID=UPI000B07B80F|nr:hypothetical protein [Burkholderia multivorans]